MGAAMAPAAADTFLSYFAESGERPEDYDLILSGDLADQWMIPQTDPEAVVAAALQDMRCAPAEPEDGQLRMPLD